MKIERDEGVAIQLMLRPVPNGWQDEGREKAEELFQGKRHKKGILHSKSGDNT